ncbi:MAG: ATP-binding protein [Candidatus Limnocylindrales bacterium]
MASERWRRRRRIGCGLAVVVVTVAVLVGGLLWPAAGFVATIASIGIIIVLLLVVAALASRLLQPTTASVGELIDGAERVQQGDYTARVTESGPTELRTLARAFNQMSDRLGRTDQQRRAFMADVSHELRTPLAVIQGQLEAVRDGVYPADAEHITPALDQVAVLERLVDDLRTLSLSESGSLTLAREPVDLGSLAVDVVSPFEATATAASVTLATEVAPGLPRAYLDRVRIGSVIRNLVANALRYTPPGGSVVIALRATGPDALELSVQDTGRGIDPALLPAVFERLSRSPDSAGSGLGLAIARSIVEAHGGTITATSIPGAGTTMTVRLPISGT